MRSANAVTQSAIRTSAIVRGVGADLPNLRDLPYSGCREWTLMCLPPARFPARIYPFCQEFPCLDSYPH